MLTELLGGTGSSTGSRRAAEPFCVENLLNQNNINKRKDLLVWDSLTDGVAEAGFETVAGMATKYYYNTEKYVDIRTYFDRQ